MAKIFEPTFTLQCYYMMMPWISCYCIWIIEPTFTLTVIYYAIKVISISFITTSISKHFVIIILTFSIYIKNKIYV